MALSSSANDGSPDCLSSAGSIECPARISAIRVTMRMTGEDKLGDLTQLEPGTLLQICGEGYNERTVKVKRDLDTFYVFREDLQPSEPSATH